MGKKDWQNLDGNDSLPEASFSPSRGRGWKVLSGVLFVATATFAAAYYLPLYRAHGSLSTEYRSLSTVAKTQHKQLEEALETLKAVSAERDQLNQVAGPKQKNNAVAIHDAESLERDLQGALKKFIGKGKLQLSREKDKLRLVLSSPALVAAATGDLTDMGKKSLCQLGTIVKSKAMHVSVQGFAAPVAGNSLAAWKLAGVRAANAAQLISESCGVDPRRVEAKLSEPTNITDDVVLAVEITPEG